MAEENGKIEGQKEETQKEIIKGDFSSLKQTGSVEISRVLDGLTILMKDGRIIRLVGLEIPGFADLEPSEYALKARDSLNAVLPEGTTLLLHQTKDRGKGRLNRMEHHLAHLEVKETGQWVQGELIKQGLARVYLPERNIEMADQLFALEKQAREDKKGIWESEEFLDQADNLEMPRNQFHIVEGRVRAIATVKNNTYLNFGQNWRDDFTVMVSSTVRRNFAKAGGTLLDLEGKNIRVRGWVRDYNGPLIELNHIHHLEILGAQELELQEKEKENDISEPENTES